jgi:hypothetical protein
MIFSYFIYHYYYTNWGPGAPERNVTTNASLSNSNMTVLSPQKSMMNQYIVLAFMVALILLILLLPALIGYFFGKNGAGLRGNFIWPNKGWLLILSAFFFIAITNVYACLRDGAMSTAMLVHDFIIALLANNTACLLQLTALLLVSSRQTRFIRCAARNRQSTTSANIKNLLREYENISTGIGPLYAVEFSIHAPIILCFAYFAMTQSSLLLVGCTNIGWSSLNLIHICLVSEDCHNAVLDLVPAIR